MTIAGLSGVHRADAGIASGLINTSRQVGGAVGLAAVTTVAETYATSAGPVHGFQVAFGVLAVAALAGAATAAVMLRPNPEGARIERLTTDHSTRLEEAA